MSTTLFGCLVTHRPGEQVGYNGLREANQAFLKAIIRYSHFSELHLFLFPSDIELFRKEWQRYIDDFGADKVIRLISVNQLPEYFSSNKYTVFHSGDPYIADLVALREHHSPTLFPIIGRAHTLSDDARLSRMRDVLLSPIKACDAILCSSRSQKTVVKRLLSSASAAISDNIGITLPYRGQVKRLALGLGGEPGGVSKVESKAALNLPEDKKVILCLGRLSPSDKMDLHPLLLALNDLMEGRGVQDFILVVAGSGDAGGPYVQSLLKRAYQLNLDDCLRFELSVDDEKKQRLYCAADVFVSLADNVQESFGITPLEAMRESVPVVLSDWDGYRELVEDGVSGCLIPTRTINCDAITRSLSLLYSRHACMVEAQSTSVDVSYLSQVLEQLLVDNDYREDVGKAGKQYFLDHFSWPGLIADYHKIVADLGKVSTSTAYRQGRAVGLSYDSVFGHYASGQLVPEQLLITTDRGLRVLLQSEHGFFFTELNELLDQQQLYQVLENCIESQSIASLLVLMNNNDTASFVIAWMMKYQLLEESNGVVIPPKKSRSGFLFNESRFNESLANDSIISRLRFPEQRRSLLIKPLLLPCIELLTKTVQSVGGSSDVLLQVSNELVNILDCALLQAIGWFAGDRKLTVYGEIIEQLEAVGGFQYLMDRYPFWYRGRRSLVFRYLRGIRLLMRRLSGDYGVVSKSFDDVWKKPATTLTGLVCVGVRYDYQVFILSFDNGEKLVYKARDLRIDQCLVDDKVGLASEVNEWLLKEKFDMGLGTHRIVCQQEQAGCKTQHYGYAQYLCNAQETLTLTESEAPAYYRNMGVLMGYSLLTGMADLHHSNVVNVNGKPCLIDAETAFHRGLFQRLEKEIKQPGVAFIRGVNGTSFETSGLYHLWQSFHATEVNYCSVSLVNGELVEAEPLEYRPVLEHVLQIKGQHIFDGRGSVCTANYVSDLSEGFAEVVEVIMSHRDEWQLKLSRLGSVEVRHLPSFNINEMRKQFRDVYTAPALQRLSDSRLRQYVERLVKRLTCSGEVSQRWLEREWQEPVVRLSDTLAKSYLNNHIPIFCSKPEDSGVFVRQFGGGSAQINQHYFQNSVLMQAIKLLDNLSDDKVRKDFIGAYQSMLSVWLNKQLVVGEGLPEDVRQTILKSLGEVEE